MKILTFVKQSQPALTNLRNNQEGGELEIYGFAVLAIF